MPGGRGNKKNMRKSAERFIREVEYIKKFLSHIEDGHVDEDYIPWMYDLAITRLHRAFEKLMLDCLIATLNRNSRVVSEEMGVEFPLRMKVSFCRYLITGGRYFNIGSYEDLVDKMRKFLPKDYWLVAAIINKESAIKLLCKFRNYAVHDGEDAKKAVKKVLRRKRQKKGQKQRQQKLSSAGDWLRVKDRFHTDIANPLIELAQEIEKKASNKSRAQTAVSPSAR